MATAKLLRIPLYSVRITTDNLKGIRCCLLGAVGGRQVKGKQVKILCDLVTVSREQKARRASAVTGKLGRRLFVHTRRVGGKPPAPSGICEPGNLPDVGTGMKIPDHEALIVPFLTDRETGQDRF